MRPHCYFVHLVACAISTVISAEALANPKAGRTEVGRSDRPAGIGVGTAVGIGTAIIFDQLSRNPQQAETSRARIRKEDRALPRRAARKEDKKKKEPAAKVPAAVTETDCYVYFQYDTDALPGSRSAKNADLKGTAEAMAGSGSLPGQIAQIDRKSGKTADLAKTIEAFAQGKKCCKKLDIMGHGSANGSMNLPYAMQPVKLKGGAVDKPALGTEERLGGPDAQAGYHRDRLEEFVKAADRVLCKGDQRPITFHTCWSAAPGFNIAEQVEAIGRKMKITTGGYTGVCDFNTETAPDDETKVIKHLPPTPTAGTEFKKFPE
jgi:hypothetical protein